MKHWRKIEMEKGRLLAIDDDPQICELLQDLGERASYQVCTTLNKVDFIERYSSFNPTFIMLDLSLSRNDGVEILRFLSSEKCTCPIVILSGCDERIRASSVRVGQSYGLDIKKHLAKPVDITAILQLLQDSQPVHTAELEKMIVQAIEKNELILYYQPKISISDQKLIGVEALVRWSPKDQPMVYPEIFIPLAEQSSFIKSLTFWVIEDAFKQNAAWKKSQYDFTIAINLSASVLDDLVLPEKIESLSQIYEVNPKDICFEVTESVMFSRLEVGMDILTRLAIKGFKISIDDFGTGFSSLVQLHKMPFSEIKVDKSFVMHATTDPDCWIIIKSIIDLGHNLRLKVVAEGVESKEVLEGLKKLNCDVAQGYYFSKPIPVDTFNEWVKNNFDQNLILNQRF